MEAACAEQQQLLSGAIQRLVCEDAAQEAIASLTLDALPDILAQHGSARPGHLTSSALIGLSR